MELDTNLLKEKEQKLYLMIPLVTPSNDLKKKKFEEEIHCFLKDLTTDASKIEYMEDYSWVNETVTFWERYLESSYLKVAHYDIPKPQQILISKEADPIYHKFLDELGKDLFKNASKPTLVEDFPFYKRRNIAEILDRKGILGDRNIKVIAGVWNNYEQSREALKKVKEKVKACIRQVSNNKEIMPLVFLYDYAFKEIQYSQFQSIEIGDLKHEIFIEIEEFFSYNNIPIVYFIDNKGGFQFFERPTQKKQWKVIDREIFSDSKARTETSMHLPRPRTDVKLRHLSPNINLSDLFQIRRGQETSIQPNPT